VKTVDPGSNSPNEITEGELLPPLKEVLQVVVNRVWIIVGAVLVCVGASLGFSLFKAPTYESSIKIIVGQERKADTPGDLGGEVQGLEQFTQTMVMAVETRPVADAVIGRLKLKTSPDAFLRNLSAEQEGASQFISVSYRDTDPERAHRVANAVGAVFSEQVSGVSPGNNNLTAVVWERATTPSEPVGPDVPRNILLGLMLGLILGVSLAFLLENLDDRWHSLDALERVSGAPTLGVIPKSTSPKVTARRRNKRGED
jgi:capsular polysaccharide biosynthesis protein